VSTRLGLGLLAWLAGQVVAGPALAHGFGQRYDLPLPLSLYLLGAGAVVAVSFILAAVFARGAGHGRRPVRWPRVALGGGHWSAGAAALRVLGVVLFVVILAAGLFGVQSPIRNLAPAMIWIVWWVGLVFVAALFANLWPLLNPWRTLFDWARRLFARLRRADPREAPFAYPRRLGVWPAVLLFYVFAWIELAWPRSEEPSALVAMALAYSFLTWSGMALFGAGTWLRHGEAFTVAFSVFGRFAPLAGTDRPDEEPALVVRPYGAGLLVERPMSASMACFVVLLLATVTFDGLMETPFWSGTVDWVFTVESLAPVLFLFRDVFGKATTGVETVALAAFPVLLLGVFLVFVAVMARIVPGREAQGGLWPLAGRFVPTLVPIAIGYHLAHYLSFLLIAGQLSIPLASDPFGYGWDLFGTAGYRIDLAVINARIVWYVAVAAIVIGHVIAVVLAHVTALRLFESRRAAMLSQIPMLVMMVGYTTLSLWILAQPIVEYTAKG
jgi:hypothetical protein